MPVDDLPERVQARFAERLGENAEVPRTIVDAILTATKKRGGVSRGDILKAAKEAARGLDASAS